MTRPTLQALSTRIQEGLGGPLPEGTWNGPVYMAEAADRVAQILAGAASEPVDPEALARVLAKLSKDEQLSDRELRLACNGATTKAVLDGQRTAVVREDALTNKLLQLVEAAASTSMRMQRRCMYGLAHAVLAPTDDEVARLPNLRRLSKLVVALSDQSVSAGDANPVTDALHELRELFESGGTGRFRSFVLDGDSSVLRPLLRFGVPAASWVWPRMILDAIADADHVREARINRILDSANELRERHGAHVKEATMGALLSRLAGDPPPDPHERLRDDSIAAWGNPRLDNTHERWLVWTTAAGRKLVARWLIQRVIATFFESLAGPYADPRRAAFWSGYADVIDDIRIYLSDETKLLRRSAVDRVRSDIGLHLRSVDDSVTDVFVMFIGRYAFVEFSTTGHALYAYASELLPFKVDVGRPRIPDFKDRGYAIDRLTHQGGWEDRVRRSVGNLTGEWISHY